VYVLACNIIYLRACREVFPLVPSSSGRGQKASGSASLSSTLWPSPSSSSSSSSCRARSTCTLCTLDARTTEPGNSASIARHTACAHGLIRASVALHAGRKSSWEWSRTSAACCDRDRHSAGRLLSRRAGTGAAAGAALRASPTSKSSAQAKSTLQRASIAPAYARCCDAVPRGSQVAG